MKKKVIGIVGTIGAGKDTVGDYIAKKLGIPSFQISSPLKAILLEREQELTRENLVRIGNELASEKGEGYLAEYIIEHAPNRLIITGIRQLGQISYLRSSSDLILISVDATPEIRFDRVKNNSKVIEAKNLAEFIEHEKAENSAPNIQRLFECMKHAEYQIRNEGSIDDLYSQLDCMLQKF